MQVQGRQLCSFENAILIFGYYRFPVICLASDFYVSISVALTALCVSALRVSVTLTLTSLRTSVTCTLTFLRASVTYTPTSLRASVTCTSISQNIPRKRLRHCQVFRLVRFDESGKERTIRIFIQKKRYDPPVQAGKVKEHGADGIFAEKKHQPPACQLSLYPFIKSLKITVCHTAPVILHEHQAVFILWIDFIKLHKSPPFLTRDGTFRRQSGKAAG